MCALLTQIVWLGSGGDRKGLFNSKSMLEVKIEVKMTFQIFSSSILFCGIPWEMFYVVRNLFIFSVPGVRGKCILSVLEF